MLAALADYGAEAAAWTEPPVALGGRRSPDAGGSPATGQRRPGARLRIDRGAGFAVAADARLDDRGAAKSWDERVYHRVESAAGRDVHVWGM